MVGGEGDAHGQVSMPTLKDLPPAHVVCRSVECERVFVESVAPLVTVPQRGRQGVGMRKSSSRLYGWQEQGWVRLMWPPKRQAST